MMNEDFLKQTMNICIDLAKKNIAKNQYPIAALITDQEGKIVATANSSLRKKNDPTNHPEIEVIRKATEIIGSRFLRGCYLFTTLEPCPMCASAAIWAKMQGIVYGASQEDVMEFTSTNQNSKFSWRQINIKAREILNAGHPRLELYEGVLREECKKLFM